MTTEYRLHSDEFKLWQSLYHRLLTMNGKESLVQVDGIKQLVLLPMMTYTIISTMLQKLKYLPNQCFNRIVIGQTPICGLRPVNQTSSPLMVKLTEILSTIIDGVRKQHIFSITMIFYKKDDINTIYDSYSLVFDYTLELSDDETATSIHMIAHMIHQIEYVFNLNDALPNDVELTFVLSALDQFDSKEGKVPKPFHFVQDNVKQAYVRNETNLLLGRLATPHGKMWLKFLPHEHQLSGSSIQIDDLSIGAHTLSDKEKPKEIEPNILSQSSIKIISPSTSAVTSPKLKKITKKSTISHDSNKHSSNLPSLVSTRNKKKTGLLSVVKSLITPSRTPAPVTSSTPNVADIVLIRHTSTPKPGETASRISISGRDQATSLSAIHEVPASDTHSPAKVISSTPSTLTTTDISITTTPPITVERRTTVRGQAAAAREKIASMQLHDDDSDDDEDENEQFKNLFSRVKPRKTKPKVVVPMKQKDDLSDISTISSHTETIFTPPTARKRPPQEQIEHGTPPKTPRTSRRNRVDDQTSIHETVLMETSESRINIDSPRLLRSATRRLQQQSSTTKKSKNDEYETTMSDTTNTTNIVNNADRMQGAYVSLPRTSIALHYSMEDSD